MSGLGFETRLGKDAFIKPRVISGDSHIDLPMLPSALFESNAPSKWLNRVPRVIDTSEGPKWIADGVTLGFVGGFSAGGL